MGELTPYKYDGNTKIIQLPSSLKMFALDAPDGTTFKAVTLPAGVDCKTIMIQAQPSTADFASYAANLPTFHLATSASPGSLFSQHVGTFAFDNVQPGGAVMGYVRAATGTKLIAVILA